MSTDAATISVSLVSHTNAGKTTLARTLLDRDIGTIRDQAHVTDTVESHLMAETGQGDRLLLWDTPGFGDSVRLARRLEQQDQALGWLRSQVWDRVRDRALWSSQQAVVHVREQADVVLYLVNAAEDPETAAYLEPEMRILAWAGRPVVVLLNQLGPPRTPSQEAAELGRWREHLRAFEPVQSVLALDAFARCWVQEDLLMARIADCLPQERRAAAQRLRAARRAVHETRFTRAAGLLAANLAQAADDRVVLASTGPLGSLRELGGLVGLPVASLRRARDEAMVELAGRWDDSLRRTTAALLELHALGGQASIEIITRVAGHFRVSEQLDEGKAAIFGGVTTGALAGLKADLATGGFTLGGGMLAGGILGALGAAGLARGINLFRGVQGVTIEWSQGVLVGKVRTLCLMYLAVAHFGRGRGQWIRAEYPPHWSDVVDRAIEPHRQAFEELLARGRRAEADPVAGPAAQDRRAAMAPALEAVLRDILRTLYPQAVPASPGAAHDR